MRHLWQVTIGYWTADDEFCDNWKIRSVIAENATQAIKLAKIHKDEELTGLRIVGSEDANNS